MKKLFSVTAKILSKIEWLAIEQKFLLEKPSVCFAQSASAYRGVLEKAKERIAVEMLTAMVTLDQAVFTIKPEMIEKRKSC